MGKYDNPQYDGMRKWIQKRAEKGNSWNEIKLACKKDTYGLQAFLNTRVEEDDWPVTTIDEWVELVNELEEYQSKQQDIKFKGNDGALYDVNQDNALPVPENERSCWQLYKEGLGWKEEAIRDLEAATHGILKRLSTDTTATGAIKGLVIGHVQSGKTANMEALMAMAADHGWNMFIILSGTIENLRLQTLKRMQNDLNKEGNLIWRGLEHPSKKSQYGDRAMDFHFEPTSQSRYFTVCLKNARRLKKLIDWIHADRTAHSKMKILIIDDEADQASISNTATELNKEMGERKGINKLIVDLVEDVHYKAENSCGKATAINYVMYTATPYANFLNESTPESLYPKDFIWTLKTSDEYIGPNQIFGYPDPDKPDGLGIIRTVVQDDLDAIGKIYKGESQDLPDSLKKSICWFICSVAAMRYWGYKKSISMLIHTSQKQDHHDVVAKAVASWINKERNSSIPDMCRKLYQKEITALPKETWLSRFPGYGVPESQIHDYPDFEKIKNQISILLNENMQHIKMNESGDLQYHKGLHLVIDNCAKNGIQNGDEYVRLAYPDPDISPYPSPASAFIIIGGSTLSRGLTIEGLVSTFFLRASCQADTLMQMGRWFGYRKGYELLPRIWMTVDTCDKFQFLSQLETELREDLRTYMLTDMRPIDYGPRIKYSPKVSWLRLTSRNHMKNAMPAEMDFSGARPQTVVFDNDADIQNTNIKYTEEFLSKLPGKPSVSYDKGSIYWKNISLSYIMENLLVNKFSFSKRSRVFNEIETFCNWLKEIMDTNALNNWSVIVSGNSDVMQAGFDSTKYWNVDDFAVGKVNRSKIAETSDDKDIDIKALRALKDGVADVDGKYIEEFKKAYGTSITKQEHVDLIRESAGMAEIPTLIIYRIDKDSKVLNSNTEGTRVDLNTSFDIIGLYISVPGKKLNSAFCKKLTIRLPEKDKEDEVDDIS